MSENIISQIESTTIPSDNIEAKLLELLSAGKIEKAKELFQDRDAEVMEAIKEHEPSLHTINNKPNKPRGKGKKPYETNKLPLSYQRYINEISTFFLLAKPIIWRNAGESDAEDEAFAEFEAILKNTRHYVGMREVKRLAGSETECAKIYHVYRNSDNKPAVRSVVISRSLGYTLRPLFDQYGDLIAFGYGYTSSIGDKTTEHFNIYTSKAIYKCVQNGGWQVTIESNEIGKIPVIYYRQVKEWDGVEKLIERMEKIKSSESDANDYFSDPLLLVNAEVVSSLPDIDLSGRALQVENPNSDAKYLEPPTALEMKKNERDSLRDDILTFSLTPDFTYENLKGLGTLSGEAIMRAMLPAFMKRDNRLEIYDELLDREKNLILAIMRNVTHIRLRNQLNNIKIEFEFAQPFNDDSQTLWSALGKAVSDKVMSRYTAIDLIGIADTTEELARIDAESGYQDEMNMFPANSGTQTLEEDTEE